MFKYYIATMMIPWKMDKNLKSHFQMHSILPRIICLFKTTSSAWSYESIECGSLEISNGTSFLSAAVVNTPTKATWGRKVFISVYRSPATTQRGQGRNSGRNLKKKPWKNVAWWPTHWLVLSQLSCGPGSHLFREWCHP